MSTATPAPTSSGSTPKKNHWSGKVLGGVIVLIVLFLIFGPVLKKHRTEKTEQGTSASKNLSTPVSEEEYYTLPPHDPITIPISGNIPEGFTFVSSGYILTFVCDQPYTVTDGDGKPYNGEANKDVDIGTIKSTESTAKTKLKFNTRNGTKTTITVQFTPMRLKKKEGEL